MENIKFFGNKEIFGIQLGLHDNLEKCKLCFWVKGRKIGSFTKGGELKYSIKAYTKFKDSKEKYYKSIFEQMTPTDIRKYFIDDMFSLGKSNKPEKVKEYEMRANFTLFFGEQFTNDSSFTKFLYNKNEVIVIYEPPKKLIAVKYNIQYPQFASAFDEYVEYCYKNKLV